MLTCFRFDLQALYYLYGHGRLEISNGRTDTLASRRQEKFPAQITRLQNGKPNRIFVSPEPGGGRRGTRCRASGASLESAAAPFEKALILANTDSGRFLIRMQSVRTVDPGEKDDEFKLRWPKHPGHDDGRFSRLLLGRFPTGLPVFLASWSGSLEHWRAVYSAPVRTNLLSRQPFDVRQSNHLAMIFRQLGRRFLLDGILFERGISTFDTG